MSNFQLNKLTHWLILIAASFIIISGLKAAAPLITQFLIIAFIAIIISPIYYILLKYKFPSWLALTIIISTMIILSTYVVSVLLSSAMFQFVKNIPDYHKEIMAKTHDVVEWLADNDINVPKKFIEQFSISLNEYVPNLAKQVGSILCNLLQTLIIVLILVSFILCELPNVKKHLNNNKFISENTFNNITQMVLHIRHYMGIKTTISIVTGAFIYIGLALFGVPSPFLLGVCAFVLNFVPVFGSILSAFPAILLSLVNFDIQTTIGVGILYIVVNQVLGNVLEPKLMGVGFGVSPVIVLISVLFWGWVLGPIGMLLAVPLTMAVKTSVSHFYNNPIASKEIESK